MNHRILFGVGVEEFFAAEIRTGTTIGIDTQAEFKMFGAGNCSTIRIVRNVPSLLLLLLLRLLLSKKKKMAKHAKREQEEKFAWPKIKGIIERFSAKNWTTTTTHDMMRYRSPSPPSTFWWISSLFTMLININGLSLIFFLPPILLSNK